MELELAAEAVEDPWKPAPLPVAEAVLLDGVPAVDVALRVAMLMVVFLDIIVLLPALTVPGAIGTVVEAVPLAVRVLLT